MRKFSVLFLVALVGLAVSTPQAKAVILNGQVVAGVPNTIEDTDFERLIKGAGNLLPTTLQVGDRLEAIATFNTFNGSLFFVNPALAPPYQLTAHINLVVASKTPVGGGLSDFQFYNGFGDNTAVKLYENPTPTAAQRFAGAIDATGTVADGVSRATSGQLVWALAIVGDDPSTGAVEPGDDFWASNDSADDVAGFDPANPTLPSSGNFNFGLTVVTNNGLAFVPNAMSAINVVLGGLPTFHDVVGNGDLLDLPVTPAITAWDLQTNTQFQWVGVPEPASILMWTGFGALAAFVAYRRRKSA